MYHHKSQVTLIPNSRLYFKQQTTASNASTHQRISASTHQQCVSASTRQRINALTHQRVNASTSRPLAPSAPFSPASRVCLRPSSLPPLCLVPITSLAPRFLLVFVPLAFPLHACETRLSPAAAARDAPAGRTIGGVPFRSHARVTPVHGVSACVESRPITKKTQ